MLARYHSVTFIFYILSFGSVSLPETTMSTTLVPRFTTRLLVPYAHDYQHGASEPRHCHECAQLFHTLRGVVRVDTDMGHWIVPPGRGVWMPAGVSHELQITGHVAARTLFIDPLARADLPVNCQVVPVSPLPGCVMCLPLCAKSGPY